jgi:hypothetical protein
MQKSIGVQKQAVQRQTGDSSEGGFFNLGGPARLPESPMPMAAPSLPLADRENGSGALQDQGGATPDPAEHPRAKTAGIADIGAIAAVADLVPLSPLGESSVEGILLKELAGLGQRKPDETGVPRGLSKEDAFDFVRQFLSVGAGGGALLQGLADDH